MAATNDGYATGAAKDEAELRQRKVTTYEKTNGQHVYKVEVEDIKKKQKVRHVLTITYARPDNRVHSHRRAFFNFSTSGNS